MDKNGRAVKLAKDTLDEIGNFGFDNEALRRDYLPGTSYPAAKLDAYVFEDYC